MSGRCVVADRLGRLVTTMFADITAGLERSMLALGHHHEPPARPTTGTVFPSLRNAVRLPSASLPETAPPLSQSRPRCDAPQMATKSWTEHDLRARKADAAMKRYRRLIAEGEMDEGVAREQIDAWLGYRNGEGGEPGVVPPLGAPPQGYAA